jgi:molybdopterin/thiamine biosynthesis adenylyltransferase
MTRWNCPICIDKSCTPSEQWAIRRSFLLSKPFESKPNTLRCICTDSRARRNSLVDVKPLHDSLSPSILLSLNLDFPSFDLILDCSDNAPTRYLLNDACVAYNKILVSGAAIRLEGQLVNWNLPAPGNSTERGPCYRCVFPEAATSQDSQNCEDEGVLGTVTGTIGTMMAAEAIKLLTGLHGPSLSSPHVGSRFWQIFNLA